ncbi:MAG: CotH kinase family protein [Calditrichota bacterium]
MRLTLTLTLTFQAAPAQELTLPIYRIYIDQRELNRLENNPWTDISSRGEIEYEGERFACRLRFRGTTARDLPKKSWKIELNEAGPNGWRVINLNSEYRDISLSRNFLSLALARWAGLPAPEARPVSLFVNDRYYGVFVEVEEVDREFYQRRGYPIRYIFKAVNHNARFSLPTNYSQLSETYEEIDLGPNDLDTLGADLSKFTFYESQSLEPACELLDPNLIIKYFALSFVSANADGFSKNYYVTRRVDGPYMLTPWDCDATWGNSWEGRFTIPPDLFCFGGLQQNAAIQVLLVDSSSTAVFNREIQRLAAEGLDFLDQLRSETFDQIEHDLQFDTLQRGDVGQVRMEYDCIAGWMEERREFLLNFQYPFNRDFVSQSLNSHYLNSENDTIQAWAILTAEPLYAALVFCDLRGTMLRINLNPEDNYGLSHYIAFQLSQLVFPLRFSWAIEQPARHYFYTPHYGIAYANYDPLSQPMIRIDPDPPTDNNVRFTDLYIEPATQTFYFGLNNQRRRPVNLSGCFIQLGSDYRRIQIPEMEPLEANESVYFSNHPEFTQTLRPNERVGGKFYFQPQVSDTLTALNCNERVIGKTVVAGILDQIESVGAVVINEINYNSSPRFNPGDWVELYVREGPIDFSGWALNDERNDHSFAFPDSLIGQTGDYVVIAQTPDSFRAVFPEAQLVIGGFEWGFGGPDQVRLFDNRGSLVDWVAYDVDNPWPRRPDGGGPTLELINPDQPNFAHDSWRASDEPYGTPGARNSVFTRAPLEQDNLPAPYTPNIASLFPNPGNGRIKINVAGYPGRSFPLVIYELNGRIVNELHITTNPAGKGETEWNGCDRGGIPVVSGLYWAGWKDYPGTCRKVVILR